MPTTNYKLYENWDEKTANAAKEWIAGNLRGSLSLPASGSFNTSITIQGESNVTGNKKFIAVCNGGVKECDSEKEALTWAEEATHSNQKTAVIFRAVKRVAPKRDTVVTDVD